MRCGVFLKKIKLEKCVCGHTCFSLSLSNFCLFSGGGWEKESLSSPFSGLNLFFLPFFFPLLNASKSSADSNLMPFLSKDPSDVCGCGTWSDASKLSWDWPTPLVLGASLQSVFFNLFFFFFLCWWSPVWFSDNFVFVDPDVDWSTSFLLWLPPSSAAFFAFFFFFLLDFFSLSSCVRECSLLFSLENFS